MNVQITGNATNEYGQSIEMIVDGKKDFFICIGNYNIQVLCRNASHRAYRYGAGRFFGSWDEAMKGYKSGAAHAAIETAKELQTFVAKSA